MNTCGRESGDPVGSGSPVQERRKLDVVVSKENGITGIIALVAVMRSLGLFPVTMRMAYEPRDGTSGCPISWVSRY